LRRCLVQARDETPKPVWNPDIPQPIDFFAGWREVPDENYDNAFKVQWELFLKHVAGEGRLPLGPARRSEGRAACRARAEELAAAQVARRAEAEGMIGSARAQPACGRFRCRSARCRPVAAAAGAAFREIEQAFFAAQVLVLRAQRLTAQQFLSFARRFGRPEPHVIDQFHHPELADILILSNRTRNGEPVGLADAGTYFHTDYSYLDVPARCTMLYSIEVPAERGDTLFANQYAAYDDLPDATKRRIDGLVALHHYGNRDDLDKASRTVASVLTEEQEQKMAWVRHRVAPASPGHRPHRALCRLGQLVRHRGHGRDEAVRLLDELKAHATQQKYQLRSSTASATS
jgi:taurine dioxygenase